MTTIAAAVEEQSATSAEIGRYVGEAAPGSHGIATTVGGVATAVRSSTDRVGETRRAATELARMSSELSEQVGRFRY
ncbi:methyl-accepting chemotaxis protein [Lapillicoccus jejuensis]|uniref:Methyl-accepting chemotaxis protein n=1 Tax=Lapillicoccus jejuensis TaxID=402171 RepID=A0A542E5W0_9MICO|nr:methyl-accepting chemotaxis protein [Lapillicoccus jejuensis]TQJ10722.1 hypothetical protein FB458_3858 [Lapillicoccus jejuensis]